METPLLDELAGGGTIYLALDPGPTQTAVCRYDGEHTSAKLCSNELVRDMLRAPMPERDRTRLAVEMIACYGMPAGRELFETCLWIGRFLEAWGGPYRLVYRLECKMHLCHDSRARDCNIRQALLDRFPGGKGTKKDPGPLYGFAGSDMYSSLAVALTAAETPGEWVQP